MAHLFRKKDHLKLGGGIHGRLEGSFRTEEAEILLETREITCPQPVVFTREDLSISAGRMEGKIDPKTWFFPVALSSRRRTNSVFKGGPSAIGGRKRYELMGGVELEL